MFSDVGIRTSIIQNAREDAAFLNTAWTLQILRGESQPRDRQTPVDLITTPPR